MKRTHLRVVSVVVALGMVVAATTLTRGYALSGPKWPSGTILMQLQLGGGSGTMLDGATSWGAVAESALATWNNSLNNVRFTVVRDSTVGRNSPDSLNSIFFDSTVFGRDFGARTLATTRYWFNGSRMTEADVVFNTAYSWNSYRGAYRSSPVDFRRVAIHEFGHALGLDHPDDYGQSVSAIMNANASNIDTVTSDDIAGAQALYGAGVSGTVSFPPRNEPNDFYKQLTSVYQNELRAALSGTYVDSEGTVIWLTEYARQRVGQCTHQGATDRTLAQITGTGGTLVCGATPAGAIPFPPRNEGLLFMNDLDSTYRSSLGRSLGSSYVNNEGSVVWVLEYLRYRLNGCSHGDATSKVLTQIRGGGIQPVCR